MFTGIIEELGRVRKVEKRGEDARMLIEAHTVTEGSADGDSISVNGVCLTALDVKPDSFAADVSKETLLRSTLGSLSAGSPVNLERAVTPATRLGGHIVQGHVDAVASVSGAAQVGDAFLIDIELPPGLSETLVLHGSVTIDGVSLTVNQLDGDKLQVSIIDYTLHHTTLGGLETGDRVQIETDVIGKYVQRIIAPYMNNSPGNHGQG